MPNTIAMINRLFLFLIVISLTGSLSAQVAVNRDDSAPDPSSALDVKFSDKGFLPPRLSHAGMDSIQNPAEGLMVFCIDCGTSGSGCLAVFRNNGWDCLLEDCIRPSQPSAGIHTVFPTQIIWLWDPVAGATGYKWGTSGSYQSATDLGNDTSRTENGLSCNTAYTRYLWAINSCGRSDSVLLSATTNTCLWSCGQPVTDPRDSKSYNTVLIGTQCWLSQNLNTGTRINDDTEQSNNGSIEKYCYNNIESNCDIFGGLYQWAEMVQYLNGGTNTSSWSPVPSGSVQGICMSGWHIPSYSEWAALLTELFSDQGGKMKESGFAHWASPNTGATNSSGFTGLPGGIRQISGGFGYLTTNGVFRGTDEFVFPDYATNLYLVNYDASANLSFYMKGEGLSVRCLKNQP